MELASIVPRDGVGVSNGPEQNQVTSFFTAKREVTMSGHSKASCAHIEHWQLRGLFPNHICRYSRSPGYRNAWIKAITVHICCLENGIMRLATGRNVAFILCLLPGESHPLPTSQTPDTRCLPPPDTRWLPLFAFPSRPFGPLPVPVRGSRAQSLPGGASHLTPRGYFSFV